MIALFQSLSQINFPLPFPYLGRAAERLVWRRGRRKLRGERGKKKGSLGGYVRDIGLHPESSRKPSKGSKQRYNVT